MTLHGVAMVASGIGFGLATVRARVLPRWTGLTLGVGVVLERAAVGIRDAAFVGMGSAVLRARTRRRA
jgi:hypothetical protein